jgi:hypothetical protein
MKNNHCNRLKELLKRLRLIRRVTMTKLTKTEASKRLGISVAGLGIYLKRMEKDFLTSDDVRSINVKGRIFFSDKFSRQETLEYLKLKKVPDKLTKIPMPDYAKLFKKSFTNYCYLKEEVNEYRKYIEKENERKISFGNPTEDFLHKTNNDTINHTKDYLRKFFSSLLINSNSSKKNLEHLKNNYIKIFNDTLEFLGREELRKKNSNEINEFLNRLLQNERIVFYRFIAEYDKIEVEKKFKMKNIFKPKKNRKNIQTKELIYDFKTFSEIYKYCNDYEKHIKKSLDGYSINGNKEKHFYSWLFSLMFLNNAWRKSDVLNMKIIDISFLNIPDLTWFNDNKLLEKDINILKYSLEKRESIVSKTGVKANFFCSKELEETFFNCLAFCLKFNEIHYPLSDKIFNYSNVHNDIHKNDLKRFFKDFQPDFIFSTLKMNRSLLSIFYSKQINTVHSDKKNISQTLRSHKSLETTNIYLKLQEEDMNKLTKNLFSKGSFGYIYDIFSGKEEKDFNKSAENALLIKETFGDIYKIENFSQFLLSTLKERQKIKDVVLKMNKEDFLGYSRKIYDNTLLGKERNIQCLVSESGCIKKGQNFPCFSCPFSIPNFYSLDLLVKELESNINKLQANNFARETEKIKISNIVYSHLIVLKEAINEFGKELLDGMFVGGFDGFTEKLSTIKSLSETKTLKRGF